MKLDLVTNSSIVVSLRLPPVCVNEMYRIFHPNRKKSVRLSAYGFYWRNSALVDLIGSSGSANKIEFRLSRRTWIVQNESASKLIASSCWFVPIGDLEKQREERNELPDATCELNRHIKGRAGAFARKNHFHDFINQTRLEARPTLCNERFQLCGSITARVRVAPAINSPSVTAFEAHIKLIGCKKSKGRW